MKEKEVKGGAMFIYKPPHVRARELQHSYISYHASKRMQQRDISDTALVQTINQGYIEVNNVSQTYRDSNNFSVMGNDGRVITVMQNHRNTRFDISNQDKNKESILLTKVKQNDDVAMCELAEFYLNEDFGEMRVGKAHSLLFKAANIGNSHAMCKLAELYINGLLGFKDRDIYLKWMMKSADHGNKYANAIVGQNFMQHYRNMPSNSSDQEKLSIVHKAIQYLEKSAAKGSTRAIWSIATIYQEGWLGSKDLPKSIEYFTRAAKIGSPSSLESLNELVKKGNFDANQLEEILEIMSPFVAKTSSQMAVDLGLKQIDGDLGEQSMGSTSRGLFMLEEAAHNRNTEAVRALATIYKNGRGLITVDSDKSLFWFDQLRILYEMAVTKGNIDAKWQLGKLWLSGDLSKVDYIIGESYLNSAVSSGLPTYIYGLGMAWKEGKFGRVDISKGLVFVSQALELWKIKALKNDISAAICVAEIYEDGDLGTADYHQAVHWYNMAADFGDNDAKYSLARIYLTVLKDNNFVKAINYIEQIMKDSTDTDLIDKTLELFPYLRQADNISEGMRWLTNQALQGYSVEELLTVSEKCYSLLQGCAMWQMSEIYLSNILGIPDYSEASKWLSLLSATGHKQAIDKLEQLSAEGYLETIHDAEILITNDSVNIEDQFGASVLISSKETVIKGDPMPEVTCEEYAHTELCLPSISNTLSSLQRQEATTVIGEYEKDEAAVTTS